MKLDKGDVVINITHKNCFDGITAAWVVNNWAGQQGCGCRTLQADYFDDIFRIFPLEMFHNAVVVITDFSLPPGLFVELAKVAKRVYVFDHHESAEKNFLYMPKEIDGCCPYHLVFDANRSGAGITYDELQLQRTGRRPAIVNIAEDHDLWRFKYPHTEAVMAYFGMLGVTIGAVDLISQNLELAISRGELLVKKDQQMVEWHLDKVEFLNMNFIRTGLKVPIVNAPRYIANKVADRLTGDYPLVIMYEDYADLRKFSVRSNGKWGINCAEVAKKLGGGGNPKTAAFTLPKGSSVPNQLLSVPGFINLVSKFKKED